MTHRIDSDHKKFIDVYSGRIHKELKKFITSGKIFRSRDKNGKIATTVPAIDIPRIVFGPMGSGFGQGGIGRGSGNKGDVIGRDGDGKGNGAGQESAEGVTINIDLEEILKFLQQELELPDLKPKENQTFEEVKIKYNAIAHQGPESLRHSKRTWLQAMKRHAAAGELDKLIEIPGFNQPMPLVNIINSDRRYRQYREIKIPSSNAAIFFARDGSGSMDQFKCDIVSDMAWWIDIWIRHFYKRVERVYVWHDTVAQEVDEKKFYRYRYGGGTTCSSALDLIAKQFENRFDPAKWNIYVFYFGDGENWDGDNKRFTELIERNFGPDVVNLFAVTQVLCWNYEHSLKADVDKYIQSVQDKIGNIRTTEISDKTGKGLSEEERANQIRKSIIDLLGNGKTVKREQIDMTAATAST